MVEVSIAGHEVLPVVEQAFDVQRDGHVARQKGQRVGVSRGFDAGFRDGTHQLFPGAQPQVAAAFGDHVAFGQVALVVGGQHLGQLFHGRVHVHQQRVEVGVQGAGARPVAVAEIQPQVEVLHGLARDQAHGPVPFHQRHGVQVGAAVEEGGHLVVRGRGRQAGRGLEQGAGRQPPVGGVAVLGQDGDLAVAQHVQRLLRQGIDGLRLRPTQEVSLHEVHPQVTQHHQLVGVLHAFGNQPRAKGVGQLLQRPQRLELVAGLVHVADEVFVDLDELRAQLRPQPQAGAPVAEIVQRQRAAVPAQHRQGLLNRVHVLHMLVLRQFHHHARQWQAGRAGLAQHPFQAIAHQGLDQGLGAEVDEQPAALGRAGPGLQGQAQAFQFQFDRPAALPGRGKERVWRRPGRRRLGADQRLVAEDAPLGHVNDGLKMDVQQPLRDDIADIADRGWGNRQGKNLGRHIDSASPERLEL